MSLKEQLIEHPSLPDLRYPPTAKCPTVEEIHGMSVQDPYRWLEGEALEIRAWEDAQNRLSRQYLDTLPYRSEMREGLKRWFDLDKMVCPRRREDNLFQWRRQAGQNHYVYYVKDGQNEERVVIDPNLLSEDGTTSLDYHHLTRDGKMMAYGISEGGSERSILRIRNVDTGEDLPDAIPNCRNSSVAWLPDKTGFYYTRLPEPGTVPEGEENYNIKIFFHQIGTDWLEDSLIFEPRDPHRDLVSIGISKDGKWFDLTVNHGWNSNDIYVAQNAGSDRNLKFVPIAEGEDNHFYVDEHDGYFYIMTNHQAPRFKLMRVRADEIDLSDKSKWETIIAENEETLDNYIIIGGKLILNYQVKACSKILITDLKRPLERPVELPLPTLGSVGNITGEDDKPEMFYSFESFAYPYTIFRVDTNSLQQERYGGVKVEEDLSQITTDQVVYTSKDGTHR